MIKCDSYLKQCYLSIDYANVKTEIIHDLYMLSDITIYIISNEVKCPIRIVKLQDFRYFNKVLISMLSNNKLGKGNVLYDT